MPESTAPPALAEPEPLLDIASLDRSLSHGLAWTGAVRWSGQLLSWASTLIVARLLTPQDYGLVGLATVYLGLVRPLSEFGIGTTVVTVREMSEAQLAQFNTLAVMIGCAACVLACAMALPLGLFFDAPGLPAVIVAMSVTFVISAFRTVPLSLLQRDRQFKALALVDGGQALLVSVAAVFMVVLGLGYWTLVVVAIVGPTIASASVLSMRRSGFAWPRRSRLGQLTTLSRQILVARFAAYVADAADSLVAGKLLGTASLGAYNLAFTLATVPVEKLTTLVGGVVPSVLSAVQLDTGAVRRYLLVLTEGIALIAFPATLGMALLAEPLVLLVLGEKWRGVIAPLQLLAVFGAVQSVAALLGHVLTARRDTRFLMRWNLVAMVVLPLAFVGGSHWGPAGIAAVWVIVHPILLVPLYRRTLAQVQVSAREYARALLPALTSSAVMLVCIWLCGEMLPGGLPQPVTLALRVLVGVATYGLSLITLHRQRMGVFLRAAHLVRR